MELELLAEDNMCLGPHSTEGCLHAPPGGAIGGSEVEVARLALRLAQGELNSISWAY